MTPSTVIKALGITFWVTVLSGCTKPPPPLPNVSLAYRNCSQEPDLATARTLILAPDKPITTTLDENAACFGGAPEFRSTYLAFDLPQSSDSYLLYVSSTQLGEGLFSPRLQLLDDAGKVLREVGRNSFMFHGTALSVTLRTHPGERYLIVSSDPNSVGQATSRVIDGVSVSTGQAGRYFYTTHAGYEAELTSVNSHNGIITVSAQPVPIVK
jgi:hypothetical protein